ncbi:apses-domain-containing protein [Auricularia subglabra TFB-10046 SS5]|nr:apses-domain-containing protein [Auricularia subglabra TFB-10046 SS5]
MPDGQIFKATYSGVPVFEMIIKGVAVMRRRADGWLNATQILKVAGFDKPQRTRILERDVQKGDHEKVQGGYGKYQGTWVPPDRGMEIAQQYDIEELLKPIVNYQQTAFSPPLAPKHLSQASEKRRRNNDYSSISTRSVRDSVRGDSPDPSISGSPASGDDISMTHGSMSRTPSPFGHPNAPMLQAAAMLRSPLPPMPRGRRGKREDGVIMAAKPANMPSESSQKAHAEAILEYFISDTNAVPDLLVTPPADFDPNLAIDDDGHTPMHWACAMGRLRIVKLLIEAGADIYRINKQGQTPLMRAVMFANNYDMRKFEELFEILHHSTLHIDIFNRTVFHHIVDLAMSKGKTQAARYYMEIILRRFALFSRELADVINWQDEDGETPLTMAARCRNKRLCKMLIDHGANPTIVNNDGKSAEMYIIEDEQFRASPILGPRSLQTLNYRVSQIVHAPSGAGASMFVEGKPRLRKSQTAERASMRSSNDMNTMLSDLSASMDAQSEAIDKETSQVQRYLASFQTELKDHARTLVDFKQQTEKLEPAKARFAALQKQFATKLAVRHRQGWERWIKDQEKRDAMAREAGLIPSTSGSSAPAAPADGEASGSAAPAPAPAPPPAPVAGAKRKRGQAAADEDDFSDVVTTHAMVPADEEERKRQCATLREEIAQARKRRRELFADLVTMQAETCTGTKLADYRRLVANALNHSLKEDDLDGVLPQLLESLEAEEGVWQHSSKASAAG